MGIAGGYRILPWNPFFTASLRLKQPVNLALRARATFVPELERVFRKQVQILDRTILKSR